LPETGQSPQTKKDRPEGLPFEKHQCALSLVTQNLAQEQLCPLGLWVVKERFWLVLLHDLTLIHKDNAVGNLTGKTHLVRDAEHRHALLRKLDHRIKNFLDHLGIKR
jgi:two-component sensor histidine kinase